MTLERWRFLDGGGGLTVAMWDCPSRHHATTEPQEWDHLKVQAFAADLRRALDRAVPS